MYGFRGEGFRDLGKLRGEAIGLTGGDSALRVLGLRIWSCGLMMVFHGFPY